MLVSDFLLTLFDPRMPIVVESDVSQFGVGAVVSNKFPNGSEKAIVCASPTSTKAEKNYRKIGKEAFALIFAV